MIALIDGDLIAYRCAASANNDPEEIAIQRCDKLLRELLEQTKADQFIVYLSTSSNFRKEINPEYKANRTQPPPVWLQQCKEFLLTEWNAKVKEFYEADDLLGINQTEDSIICSLDKDLKMIPGEHYSWEISGTTVKGATWTREAEFTTTTPEIGIRTFYKQLIVGDSTDNIFGIRGLGPVKAAKLIDALETEDDMFDCVRSLYNDDTRFLINAQCLWIMRKVDETFLQRKCLEQKISQDKDLENLWQLSRQQIERIIM